MFSRTYGAKLADIFAVQRSIVRGIASQIPSVADGTRRGRVIRQPTEVLAAYNEYIEGRHQMWKRTAEGIAKAKQHFESDQDLPVPGPASRRPPVSRLVRELNLEP